VGGTQGLMTNLDVGPRGIAKASHALQQCLLGLHQIAYTRQLLGVQAMQVQRGQARIVRVQHGTRLWVVVPVERAGERLQLGFKQGQGACGRRRAVHGATAG